MMKVLFNNIGKTTNYIQNIELLYSDYNLFRKKHFSNLNLEILQKIYPSSKLFLTHSATGALEMIALLMNIQKGDEVILPSFTFVSSANAFVSRGATPVFVDIETETLNLDLELVEKAITPKTRAIIAVHYAGHSCDLNRLKSICEKHNLFLVEDAAMAFGNTYDGKPLGTIGDFGVISFDITKQISAVQGGLLLVNNQDFRKRAGYIYHIGTNREDFMEGNIPYYEWVDVGSKFQMNEMNAVSLYDQLIHFEEILTHRNKLSKQYYEQLKVLEESELLKLMPLKCLEKNYHEFYLLLKSKYEREKLTSFLATKGIETMFHYIPLHSSQMGSSVQLSNLPKVTEISDCLLRLPLHTEIGNSEVEYISETIKTYYNDAR
jgi:dTDP-4-amino-4,6-dideoxygalactose transaminase